MYVVSISYSALGPTNTAQNDANTSFLVLLTSYTIQNAITSITGKIL